MRARRKKNLEPRFKLAGDVILARVSSAVMAKPESEREMFIDIAKSFGNDLPVELEIGCGKGAFIAALAKNNPDKNYVGVELNANVLISAAELIKNENIKNVKFINGSATLLPYLLKENSVGDIYLNFSCPYPKKTYANHRLTYPAFLDIYKKLLIKGGKIYQKTDNVDFFEYSLESFEKSGYNIEYKTFDLYASDSLKDNIKTEYEEKFTAMGKKICKLIASVKE